MTMNRYMFVYFSTFIAFFVNFEIGSAMFTAVIVMYQ